VRKTLHDHYEWLVHILQLERRETSVVVYKGNPFVPMCPSCKSLLHIPRLVIATNEVATQISRKLLCRA
jgi:hypothetical protein